MMCYISRAWTVMLGTMCPQTRGACVPCVEGEDPEPGRQVWLKQRMSRFNEADDTQTTQNKKGKLKT